MIKVGNDISKNEDELENDFKDVAGYLSGDECLKVNEVKSSKVENDDLSEDECLVVNEEEIDSSKKVENDYLLNELIKTEKIDLGFHSVICRKMIKIRVI